MGRQTCDEAFESRLRPRLDQKGSVLPAHQIGGDAALHPLKLQINRHDLHCEQIG